MVELEPRLFPRWRAARVREARQKGFTAEERQVSQPCGAMLQSRWAATVLLRLFCVAGVALLVTKRLYVALATFAAAVGEGTCLSYSGGQSIKNSRQRRCARGRLSSRRVPHGPREARAE
jgi:hypothetical protein